MLRVVDLPHVIVDFSALRGWDVGRGIFTFMDKFLEEWINLTEEGLSIQCSLHDLLSFYRIKITGFIIKFYFAT